MGIQNQIGNKIVNGIKSLLTNTALGGLLHINNADGSIGVLPIGTSGQVLTVASGSVAWSTGVSPTGNAGGDLTGTYPNPTIAANVVTYAKMQNVTATSRILGRITIGAGVVEELTGANVATILGLGTAAYLNIGVASGNIPILDGAGKLDIGVIPALRSHEYYEVANAASRLTLTTSQVQPGDTVYQLDTNESYILTTTDPSIDGNWRLQVDTTIPASYITSGTISTARLGSGTANATTFLAGDNTWKQVVLFTWNTVSGTSQAMVADNGYVVTNAALTTLTLPTTAAINTIIEIVGTSSGGWRIAQNSDQQIRYLGSIGGINATTIGTTGRIDAGVVTGTDAMASIKLLCTTANTTWHVISATGNVDVV